MTIENTPTGAAFTLDGIDAVVRRARAERAEAMSAAIAELPALFKRLAVAIRPNRRRLPQTGAWA